MSARLRALLAVAWFAGFYVLGLALVGALLWVPWAEGTYSRHVSFSGVISGVLGLTVAWALRPRFAPKPQNPGRTLERSRAPALFSFVEDLARRTGARVPEELSLTLEATAFTALERRGLFRRVPTMTLGLPLLMWMKQDELAAVVAHEFGHHVGDDVSLGPWVYRTRLALADAIEQLDDSVFFLDVPFRAYGRLFLRLTASVSRGQELSADALSAKIAGATAARNALRLVHEHGPLWQVYVHLDVIPFFRRGLRLPLMEGYRALPEPRGLREEFAQAVEEMRQSEASPWDTHPTQEQRLAALPQGEGLLSGSPRALRLLGEVERDQETLALETTFTGDVAGLRELTWDQLGPWLVETFGKALEGTVLEKHARLDELPALLADGESLSERLATGVRFMSREARRKDAAAWLVQWLTVRLAAGGFEPRWAPGAGLKLVRGDEAIVAQELVDAVESGELTAANWATRCRAWEVAAQPSKVV